MCYRGPWAGYNGPVQESGAAPTAPHASSTYEAPARHRAGPRNAAHCEALRTRATGQPASTNPSAAEPATADASSAAIGGAKDTCHQSPNMRSQNAKQPLSNCLDWRSEAVRRAARHTALPCRTPNPAGPHDRKCSVTAGGHCASLGQRAKQNRYIARRDELNHMFTPLA